MSRARRSAALDAGLTPIVCVGERLAERESGQTQAILVEQFRGGIGPLDAGGIRQDRDRL